MRTRRRVTPGTMIGVTVAAVGVGWLGYIGGRAVLGRRAMSDAYVETYGPRTPDAIKIPMDPHALSSQPADVAGAVLAQSMREGRLTHDQAATLSLAVRDALQMYISGGVEAYEDWLDSQGLSPPAAWAQRLEANRESIDLGFETLRDAPLATDETIVRAYSLANGAAEDGSDATAPRASASRSDRIGPSAADGSVYEVVVPAQVRARRVEIHQGSASLGAQARVDARLGLVYRWDTQTRTWIIIELHIYDLQQDVVAVMPPL